MHKSLFLNLYRTQLSAKTLQELKYVTDQVGVSFDAIQTSSARLVQQIRTAATGSDTAMKGFRALGVELKNLETGAMRPINDIYLESIQKLSDMQNATERNVFANMLFGRQFIEIVPLLNAGAETIETLSKRAQKLGLIMGDDLIKNLVEYKDTKIQ